MSKLLVNISNLVCVRNERLLFKKLNFSACAGELWHIVGPNGCGKSSLLQILSGLLSPQSGCVEWSSEFAYVGHKQGIKMGLTVLENLDIQAQLNLQRLRSNWQEIFTKLTLNGLEHELCQCLSAGQRQRVALARLLILNAKVWLLDEPFTAVDKTGVAKLHTILTEHVEQGGLVILTSHQPVAFNHIPVNRLELGA